MTHVSRNKLIRGENVLFITKPSFCVILRCFCWTRAGTQSVFVCPKQKTCKISRVPQVTHVTIHIYLPFTYVRRPSIFLWQNIIYKHIHHYCVTITKNSTSRKYSKENTVKSSVSVIRGFCIYVLTLLI